LALKMEEEGLKPKKADSKEKTKLPLSFQKIM
jgi:hypothetical protein